LESSTDLSKQFKQFSSGDLFGSILIFSADTLVSDKSQVQDGQEKVISYYSKSFSKAERKYCVTRRDLLAVVASIKNFHQ
jgi:hypothetical protein